MRLAILQRFERLLAERTLRLSVLGRENIRVEKDRASAAQSVIDEIIRFARGITVWRHARRIERDKHELVEKLKDVKTNPAPHKRTYYDTEGAAVEGCASPVHGGTLLYSVVRAARSGRIVEIGAAHGYGAAYIGSALKDLGQGKLLTTEGMYVRVNHSRETIQRLGLSGYVEVVEGDFRETVPACFRRLRPLDLAFVDGDKSVDLTRQHFELCLEEMSAGGHVFFDDINFNEEIEKLWLNIVSHERVALCLTFYRRWALLRIAPVQR